MDQVKELKKLRSSLSCTLSTIRREIKNPALSKAQLTHKIERGLKTATKYIEVSDQLSKLGVKCEYKAPHMKPEWWENISLENNNISDNTKDTEVLTVTASNSISYPKHIDNDIIKVIKETIKSEFTNFIKELNPPPTNDEYELCIAWTDGIGNNESVNKLLSIIGDYLNELKIPNFRKERYDNECIDIYRYSGDDFNTIKKTIQFMIDRWGEDTNVSIYGKLCKY